MRLLLDTHVLLWALGEPERLTSQTRETIQDARTSILVSVASVWEMAIKAGLGKLAVPDDLEEQLIINRFETLSISFAHARAVESLPSLHRDPFDRMLVSQAQHEGLTLVTRDVLVQQYDVDWLAA